MLADMYNMTWQEGHIMNVFFLITGLLIILLCQKANVHIDAFSLAYILLNFSVVGTIATLYVPTPLLMKQFYMVWIGIIVAYIFTWIPEWTGWVLLILMALYDIAAVLIPGGPLRVRGLFAKRIELVSFKHVCTLG
eukprot:363491-Chlamydomonas_euryale.AAC.3